MPTTCLLYTSELYFHKRLMNDTLPLSIRGGIGQSRLCMFYLRKAHTNRRLRTPKLFYTTFFCARSMDLEIMPYSIISPSLKPSLSITPVSYTHLDVYKRQLLLCVCVRGSSYINKEYQDKCQSCFHFPEDLKFLPVGFHRCV